MLYAIREPFGAVGVRLRLFEVVGSYKKKMLHREQKLRDQHTLSLPRYLGRIFALNIATGSRE